MVNLLDDLDANVASCTEAYRLFMSSILGEFRRFSSVNVGRLSARNFKVSALSIQQSALRVITSEIDLALNNVEQHLSKPESVLFAKIKSDTSRKLVKAIQAQMLLDIDAARSDMLRYALSVLTRIDAGESPISAKVAADKTVRFQFVDRSGKRWASERYVATVIRGEIIKAIYFVFILQAEIEGRSELLMSDGPSVSIDDVEQFSHPNTKVIPVQQVKSPVT